MRRPPNRRVTPLSARREMQRRAATALLALVVVVGGLGAAVFVLGGRQISGPPIESLESAQQQLAKARANLARVIGPGIDLVTNDWRTAETLLSEAYTALQGARNGGIPSSTIDPIQNQVVRALNRGYKMVDVVSKPIFQFPEKPKVDLRALVRGPDGAPFILDAATKTVYRIDLKGGRASVIFRDGTRANGATESTPRLLGVGGRDLLMVDARNVIWRWQPANSTGKGTITRVRVNGAAELGDDILAIGTFLRDADANLYNLYIVDPSAQQILRYSPAADGSGFPQAPNKWLTAARDVAGITSMYIDGDIFLADAGDVMRVVEGSSEGWEATNPGDEVLRTAPAYRVIESGAERREGILYCYDPANHRVIALSKTNGTYLGQYRLAGGDDGWSDLRDFYVEPGVEGKPDAIVWLSATGLHRAVLEASTSAPASPGPSGGASASPAP